MIDRITSPRDRRDVRLRITRDGESVITADAGIWDPLLLEPLRRLPGLDNLMNSLDAITQAAEDHATALAAEAIEGRHRARHIPRPLRWG
jgi:DNA-binding MarR family transcriptional regulator